MSTGDFVAIALSMLRIVELVLGKEKASKLMSLEAVQRANYEADLMEEARFR